MLRLQDTIPPPPQLCRGRSIIIPTSQMRTLRNRSEKNNWSYFTEFYPYNNRIRKGQRAAKYNRGQIFLLFKNFYNVDLLPQCGITENHQTGPVETPALGRAHCVALDESVWGCASISHLRYEWNLGVICIFFFPISLISNWSLVSLYLYYLDNKREKRYFKTISTFS